MKLSITLALCILLAACTSPKSDVQQEVWGEVNNTPIYLYTLSNTNGMEVKITNYGGIITSVLVPDKAGNLIDVVLGFDNLKQYIEPNPCFGAAIGRVANRIKNATFTINDSVYTLSKNDGEQCAHGGGEFNKAVWDAQIVKNEMGNGIKMKYVSKDGSNGFPGNLTSYVTYTLTDDNAIHITFEAETDKATHVNMTQHSYFNLNGGKENIRNHEIKIDADYITAIDENIVPTGELLSVLGEKMDLSQLTPMGKNMDNMNYGGYHYCYVFNNYDGKLKKVIEVSEPTTGITMDVITTQPGVQFYSGNAIADHLVGKYNIKYGKHAGFCLETEHLPNTPNIPHFPTTLVKPGEKYHEVVIYDFGVKQ